MLRLSKDLADFRDELRAFFEEKVPTTIRERVLAGAELEKAEIVASHRVLNAAGVAVPSWPERWGGRGWSQLQQYIWLDEMHSAGVPTPLNFNVLMVGPVIAAFGSESMQERFLPATANLDIWWSQGFSEPSAGSDLASLRTSAVLDDDSWVVNGQKTWTTHAQHGDWIFCLVRTDPTAKKQAGISFLLVDLRSPGITIRPIELVAGGSTEVNEVFFDEVRVPTEHLVGEVNRGWDYAKFLLGNERLWAAPVGSTKAQLRRARHLLDAELPSGSRRDALRSRITVLENELTALDLTVLRTGTVSVDGRPHPAASVLKLVGSRLQQAVTELLVDIAGPAGLLKDSGDPRAHPWAGVAERYLNFRKASIYGGSSEVQRQIIAKSVLGLEKTAP